MSAKSEQIKFDFTSFHLSVRYRTVLFPFDLVHFMKLLPFLGYVVSRSELLSIPAGSTFVSITGDVARKGNIELRMSTEKNVIAFQGPDMDALVSELDSLEESLKERLGFDSNDKASFYELIADLSIVSQQSPLKSIQRQFEDMRILKEFGQVLGRPTSNFTLRLVPAGVDPNGTDWFDIRLEPSIRDCQRSFEVHVVARNEKRPIVIDFARNLQETLEKLIAKLQR